MSRVSLELVLLDEDHDLRSWSLRIGGRTVGSLAGRRSGDRVRLSGTATDAGDSAGALHAALGRTLGTAPWGHDVVYTVPSSDPLASAAPRAGFRLGEGDEWLRDAPRRRVDADDVARFLDASGRIDRYPQRAVDRRELLTLIAVRALPLGDVLTEREVNERLAPFAPREDVAVLRRHLVDHGLIDRTRSGSEYVRRE